MSYPVWKKIRAERLNDPTNWARTYTRYLHSHAEETQFKVDIVTAAATETGDNNPQHYRLSYGPSSNAQPADARAI
ncbi:hypothetical protein [Xanthomonas sacchari]|uniref:hypothetical protein n=1 Tax=Xanthomonas sacchari TaxID=56458 RepID=UPI003B20D25A